MVDVAVIGGGMAGAAAAVAARRAGASVALVRVGIGATALASGAIDLADTLPPGGHPRPLADALRATLECRPAHPLGRIAGGDADGIVSAYRDAVEVVRAPLALTGDPAGCGALLTAAGTWHPGGVFVAGHGPGTEAALDGSRFHVVTLDLTPDFVPERITAALDTGLPRFGGRPAEPATCSLGETVRLGAPPRALPAVLARLFDDPAFAEGFAAHCAERVRRFRPTHVVFPPVLGLTRARENLALLEKALGARCFEALSPPPSVPGFRLQAALDAALAAAGVEVREGRARFAGAGLAVEGAAGAGELPARAVVLATGKFVGGGLARNGSVRETVYGLPVCADGEPLPDRTLERYLTRRPGERQPLLAAGVRVDAELRPLDRNGQVARPGLFAAGAVLDGVDFAADLGGLGLALLTGAQAGRTAAREARP